MPSKEPSRTKLKNAASAAKSAALAKIPKELLDQIVAEGPMTAEQINSTTMALKKALIERALGGEPNHLGYPPGSAHPKMLRATSATATAPRPCTPTAVRC